MITLLLCYTKSITGLLLLSGTASLVFLLAFIGAISYKTIFPVLIGLFLLGLFGGLLKEGFSQARTLIKEKVFATEDTHDCMAVFVGTLLTYYLNRRLGVGAVLASSLVGMLAALTVKKQAAAVFCGSFAGMSCPQTFSTWYCIGAAGFIAGFIYFLGKDLFKGVGGKLGTIAFAATLGASYLRGIELPNPTMPDLGHAGIIVFYSIIGVFFTYMLNHRFGHGPILASAGTGMVAGVLLPGLHGAELGNTLAVMMFCASFAGMSDRTRLPNLGLAIFAGLLCGLIFIHSTPYLGGAGGKLGAIAFGAVIACSSVAGAFRQIHHRFLRLDSRPNRL